MKNFLIGILIGIGKILPGVSGAMFAISFNIYENMLEAIADFFKAPKKSIKYLFPICLGIILAIAVFSNLIKLCLDKYYLYTISLFIGLMIGGFYNFSKHKKITKSFVVSFLFIVLFPIILNNNVKISNKSIQYLFLMGIIDSFATIVPGVSGTALLIIFGSYDMIIKSFSNLFDTGSIIILIPFFMGFLVGIILISKMINCLYHKNKEQTDSLMLGLSSGSILLLIINYIKVFHFNILSIILMTIGFIIGKFIDN